MHRKKKDAQSVKNCAKSVLSLVSTRARQASNRMPWDWWGYKPHRPRAHKWYGNVVLSQKKKVFDFWLLLWSRVEPGLGNGFLQYHVIIQVFKLAMETGNVSRKRVSCWWPTQARRRGAGAAAVSDRWRRDGAMAARKARRLLLQSRAMSHAFSGQDKSCRMTEISRKETQTASVLFRQFRSSVDRRPLRARLATAIVVYHALSFIEVQQGGVQKRLLHASTVDCESPCKLKYKDYSSWFSVLIFTLAFRAMSNILAL